MPPKVSGAFSEIEPLPPAKDQQLMDVQSRVEMLARTKDQVQPWFDVVLEAFGPRRVMFGSDWPVCNVGGGGNSTAWKNWIWIAERLAQTKLSQEDQAYFWGKTAAKVYKIQLPDS